MSSAILRPVKKIDMPFAIACQTISSEILACQDTFKLEKADKVNNERNMTDHCLGSYFTKSF